MDADQTLKRIQWVEEERRKDKDAMTLLENRLVTVEGGIKGAQDQVKQLSSEITRLATILTRMDQYDTALLQQRVETKRSLDEIEKDTKKREEEAEKARRVELRALENSIADMRRQLDVLPRLEKGIQMRSEEDVRLRRSLDELSERLNLLRRDEEEYTRTYRLLEDGRRQDAKRLTDLQGETAVLRKQADGHRGQIDILNNTQRKLETRLNELVAVEVERRDSMSNFLDKQTLVQVERDRVWRDWQARFETIEKQAGEIEGQLLSLDATNREARRVQTILEELHQKVERRLSEITEIQRLSEDRFRQEWVTFKADDQKRWTNYSLTQDELTKNIRVELEKLVQRIAELDDSAQVVQDMMQQTSEVTETHLQGLMNWTHDFLTNYERTIGRPRLGK